MGSDPQVPPCIPGDVGGLSTIQGNFAAIAAAASRLCGQLQNTGGQIVWSGKAHDAFQAGLKDVPYDLQKVAASFGQAATALQTYLGTLSEFQSQYTSALNQFVPLFEQQQRLNDQLSSVTPGFFSSGPTPQQQQEQQYLNAKLSSIGPELDRLYNQLLRVYYEAAGTAETLSNALNAASNAGIQDSFG